MFRPSLRLSEAGRGVPPVSAPKTSASFAVFSVTVWLIMPLLCPAQQTAQLGTTPNIKQIVVGRCYHYIAFVDPGLRCDCEDIWRQFEEVVARRSSCNVTAEDYHPMFYALPRTWPCGTFLFWSKTRTLMHSYAAVVRRFWTLEDTLVGHMFNHLVWCGKGGDSAGFDFSSCPEWSACESHPVYSLWTLASQNFAEMACGNVTVLLNGSIVDAFDKKSMFGSVEVDGLNPRRVDYVNIKVATNPEGPYIESCCQGSVVDLIQVLRSRGFRWTCTDNDQPVRLYTDVVCGSVMETLLSITDFSFVHSTLMVLQSIQNPKRSSCQSRANHLSV